jgi:large subunit ribosomal protein L7/L12
MKSKAKPKGRIAKAASRSADPIAPTLERGKQLLRQGHLKESDRIFQTLARSGIDGLYGMGLVRLQAGQLNAAASYFQKCIQLDGRHANSYFYLGQILERLKSLKIAHALYVKALLLKPGHLSAQARLVALENYRGKGTAKSVLLILRDPGPDKIKVLIAIREVSGMDLETATRLVEGAPQILMEMDSKDRALATKKRLEALGAKIEVA